MQIDLKGLEAFIAIADAGSFLAAAERLNLSQTALSHRIAKLEADLGVTLIARTSRRLSLTAEGIALLPRARASIGELAVVIADLRHRGAARRRQVSFGCIPTLAASVLVPILGRFGAEHPTVRVRVNDGYASTLVQLVRSGQLDFALIVSRGAHFETVFKPLRREGFVVLCPTGHPLAGRASVRFADLEGHALIGNSVIADALRDVDDRLDWRFRVENAATAVSLVEAGLGVTLVPALASGLPGRTRLAAVPVAEPGVSRRIGLVTRPDMPLGPAAAELAGMIRAKLWDGSAEGEG
jgi:DNA-binding transcriptional LysR family regulator